MKRTSEYLLVFFLLGGLLSMAQTSDEGRVQVKSSDGQIVFDLSDAVASRSADSKSNDIRYSIQFRGKPLMSEAVLGLKPKGEAALGPGMHKAGVSTETHDETYSIPVGK